jgi:hypothetical protein
MDQKSETLPQRLCSEIQLFDLCDLDACSFRSNRFCTNPNLLSRFEKIADVEQQTPVHYTEEFDDEEGGAEEGYDDDDDELSMDNYDGGEDDGWED